MVSRAICAASWLVYDVLFLCLFVCFMRLLPGIFHACSYDTYIIVVPCMKQNKDAAWSLVLFSVTGVRADPKYSYSYDLICMYVRIVTFDFSLKKNIFLVGTWQSVRSRYAFFFGFNNMRRNTCRSDFVRYQAKT